MGRAGIQRADGVYEAASGEVIVIYETTETIGLRSAYAYCDICNKSVRAG